MDDGELLDSERLTDDEMNRMKRRGCSAERSSPSPSSVFTFGGGEREGVRKEKRREKRRENRKRENQKAKSDYD